MGKGASSPSPRLPTSTCKVQQYQSGLSTSLPPCGTLRMHLAISRPPSMPTSSHPWHPLEFLLQERHLRSLNCCVPQPAAGSRSRWAVKCQEL